MPHIFVDFDGTIARCDTTDLLLEQFADPRWTGVEAAWQRGEIGSRDCMAAQVALLRATPGAFALAIRRIEIDPGFKDFVVACGELGLSLSVLSDGLDMVADAVLRHAGLVLPVLSNRLRWLGDDRWGLSFPHARPDCTSGAGTCKCGQLSKGRAGNAASVLIGDGRSDFCGAAEADMVFAKGRLAAHCRGEGLPHIAFDGFADLLPRFRHWLLGGANQPGAPARAALPSAG